MKTDNIIKILIIMFIGGILYWTFFIFSPKANDDISAKNKEWPSSSCVRGTSLRH